MWRKFLPFGLTIIAAIVITYLAFYLRLRPFSYKVSHAEVQAFTAHLAVLAESRQYSLVSALEIAANRTPNPYLRQVLLTIRSDVLQNVRLYQAMEKYPDIFSPAYIFAVKHGTNISHGVAVFKEMAKGLPENRDQQWVFVRHLIKRHALEALKEPDWMNRGFALRALAEIGEKDVIAQTLPLLNDPHPKVRKEAKETLKKLGYTVK